MQPLLSKALRNARWWANFLSYCALESRLFIKPLILAGSEAKVSAPRSV
jgi:hypothetical protein